MFEDKSGLLLTCPISPDNCIHSPLSPYCALLHFISMEMLYLRWLVYYHTSRLAAGDITVQSSAVVSLLAAGDFSKVALRWRGRIALWGYKNIPKTVAAG